MKKLLKFCAAVLAVVVVFSMSGCSARSSITADEFSKQAKAAGFTVQEETTTAEGMDKVVSATKTESGTEIFYISFKEDSSAEDIYKNMRENISKGASGTSSTLDSSTYCKYTLVNGELNHTLVRLNNTIVYGKATTPVKDQVDSFFKTIKY